VANDVNAERRPEQARTRLARRAVIDAARELFVEGGYAMTTMAAISGRAEVPEPTVYRLFGSKVAILKVLLDVAIAGDDEPTEVLRRPKVAALLDEPDAHRVLAGFAAVTTQINRRTNDLYEVLRRAADSDAEAAELLGSIQSQRDRGQEHVVRTLHGAHQLRHGLGARDASDVVHAVMSPEVYRLLVGDRGWSPSRFQRWATQVLIDQLL
jgi:AcrR family transcriptional regulator